MLKPVPLWNLTGGLVVDVPPASIPENATDSCSNVVFVDGKIIPRPGLASIWDAQSNSNYHLSKIKVLGGTETVIGATLNTSTNAVDIFKLSGTSWSSIKGALSPTGSEDIYPTATQFKGEWFFTPGTSGLVTWNGVAASASLVTNAAAALQPPTLPKFVIAAPSGSNLFLMNFTDSLGSLQPYGIAWSGFLDSTKWNGGVNGGGSGSQLLAEDNEPITGATTFGPFIIALKARSTYVGQLSEWPKIYEITRMDEDRGCVAQGSIASSMLS